MIFSLAEGQHQTMYRLQNVLYPRLIAREWFSRVEPGPLHSLIPEGVGGDDARTCPCQAFKGIHAQSERVLHGNSGLRGGFRHYRICARKERVVVLGGEGTQDGSPGEEGRCGGVTE